MTDTHKEIIRHGELVPAIPYARAMLQNGELFDQTARLLTELLATIDQITDGFLLLNGDGTVRHLNEEGGRILSLKPANAIGHRFSDLVDFRPIVDEVIAGGRGYVNREFTIQSKTRFLHLLDTAVPIVDDSGKIVSVVNTFREMKRVRTLANRISGYFAEYRFEDLIGSAPIFMRAIATARKVARGDSTVLLQGESGTGKELFAHAIHHASARSQGPFIPLNCAALPRDLVESELFGYAAGSFTGAATRGRAGKFELASGGTLFLDEISELPVPAQAKLLRVIQERKVSRIGDTRLLPIDTRLIAATNRNLLGMVDEGSFRADLYYRINVLEVSIPPLRDRPEDIPGLAAVLLARAAERLGKRPPLLAPNAEAQLLAHSWPGNVRELQNLMERVANLTDEPECNDLGLGIVAARNKETTLRATEDPASLREIEVRTVRGTLARCNFNISKAAKSLGISRSALYAKIRMHGIELPDASTRLRGD